MKYIKKSEEPESFVKWKALANENWAPVYKDLQKPEKTDLHKSLLREQGYICCYCGIRLKKKEEEKDSPSEHLKSHTTDQENLGKESHIEHLKPQTTYPSLALEYSNLLASCEIESEESESTKIKKSERLHCGQKKSKWYCEDLMISPLQSNCAEFFGYSEAGQILSANEADEPDKQAADTTIDKLNLNIFKLIALRKAAMEAVLEGIEDQSDEDIKNLIQGYNQQNDKGEYEEFCAAIIYILNQKLLDRQRII